MLSDDLCARRAWYGLRWQAPFLTPKQILVSAVDHGLLASGDAGEAAETYALDLCVNPGLDTAEPDMLAVAEHIASFANLLAWTLQGTGGPWKRPEAIRLPDGSPWTTGAFLSPTETHLRRVVLLDRWDAWAETALERGWDTAGECSVYGAPMDCLIVEIGAMRNGRWGNPFTRGYRHPVSKTLRFRKRDGEDFGSTWSKVEREHESASREEWLGTLTEDGILAETIHVHQVPVPERSGAILHLAQSRLARIREAGEPPEENLSMCFSRMNPCPFRSCCPRGEEPSESLGFTRITSCP